MILELILFGVGSWLGWKIKGRVDEEDRSTKSPPEETIDID